MHAASNAWSHNSHNKLTALIMADSVQSCIACKCIDTQKYPLLQFPTASLSKLPHQDIPEGVPPSSAAAAAAAAAAAGQLLPAVQLVAARLGWQVVPENSPDWDLFWTDTSISQERLMRLEPTQVRPAAAAAAAAAGGGGGEWSQQGLGHCQATCCSHCEPEYMKTYAHVVELVITLMPSAACLFKGRRNINNCSINFGTIPARRPSSAAKCLLQKGSKGSSSCLLDVRGSSHD
jgi:hypothetical protein